jgi:hypothetical protein
MAPAFGADHSITPESAGPDGQALYEDFGPLFSALRGACWFLVSRPVVLDSGPPGAVANAFTRGGGCTASGGTGPVAELLLYAWAGPSATDPTANVSLAFLLPRGLASPLTCESVSPNGKGWIALPSPSLSAGRWRFGAPLILSRGSLMVRCSNGTVQSPSFPFVP